MSLVLISCAILAGVWVGMFAFSSTTHVLRQSIGATHELVARQALTEIDRLLSFGYRNITSIAGDETFANFLVANQFPPSEASLTRRLRHLDVSPGPWDALMLIDQRGTVVLSSKSKLVGQPISAGDPLFSAIEAALAGKVHYSDVIYFKETGRPSIIFAAPVKDVRSPHEPIVGVVAGYYSWPVILEVLEDLPGVARLYNRSGIMIGTNNPDERNLLLIRDDLSTPSLQAAFDDPALFGSRVVTGFSGDPVLHTHARQVGFFDYRGSDWLLIFEEATSHVFAPARETAVQLAAILTLILLVSFTALIFWLTRLIARPLSLLTKTVRIITMGDYGAQAPVLSSDEIGELAQSFNQMTQKLKDSYQTLDERNRSLVQERDKTNAIIHSIADAVMVVDHEGIIRVFNPGAERVTGYRKDEALGVAYHILMRFVSEKDMTHIYHLVEDTMSTGEIAVLPAGIVLVGKDGKVIPVTDSAAPLKDKRGKVFGVVIIFRDNTKERAIDRAKSEFVSLASHQLRTPPTGIKWYANMLLEEEVGSITPDQRSYLEEIIFNNQRMIDVVNAMLSASRLELGTFSAKPEETDAVKLVESILNELLPQIKSKMLVVERHFPDTPFTVMIDPTLLRMILQNLIVNSVKYTSANGTITITLEPDAHKLEISVADTGCGIPHDEQGKIFTKLFRANNARVLDPSGTGLGLYIVKRIVDELGGTIRFESEESRGTTFFVLLPVKKNA